MMPIILSISGAGWISSRLTRTGSLSESTILRSPMKESAPHCLRQIRDRTIEPAGGGTPPTKNPFAKDSFNLTEQEAVKRKNPTQAQALAAAAE